MAVARVAPEYVPLISCLREGREVCPPFWAVLDGEVVVVTAVLQRTCVWHSADVGEVRPEDRHVTRFSEFLVDPQSLSFRPYRRAATGISHFNERNRARYLYEEPIEEVN